MTLSPDSGQLLASRILLEVVTAPSARVARKPHTRRLVRLVRLVGTVGRLPAWPRRLARQSLANTRAASSKARA
jgi:hypothetical protein